MYEAGDLDLSAATVQTFAPHVGSGFVIDGVQFTLTRATAVGEAPEPGLPAPFELVFEGPQGVPQRLYRLAHASLGGVLLFLVPLAPGRYITYFN
jgi:hypothetical protein